MTGFFWMTGSLDDKMLQLCALSVKTLHLDKLMLYFGHENHPRATTIPGHH